MKYLKDKKIIGITVLLVIVLGASLFTYGKNKKNVFKDEYMQDIFIEDNQENIAVKDMDTITNSDNMAKSNETLIVVEIKGEVKRPDVYELSEGSIIKDLIDIAGGLTTEADISTINRAKQLQNHELIIIANVNDLKLTDSSNIINTINTQDNTESTIININNATIEQLKEIPGIGDVKAQSIIDYREENGGFRSLEELKEVDGIGEKTFEKIKDKITL